MHTEDRKQHRHDERQSERHGQRHRLRRLVPDAKLTPEGLQTWLKSEIDKWGPVIRAAGVYAD